MYEGQPTKPKCKLNVIRHYKWSEQEVLFCL